jgi:hypothetical protein
MTSSPFPFHRGALVATMVLSAVCWTEPAGAQAPVPDRPVTLGFGLGAAAGPGLGIGSSGLATLGFHSPWRAADFRLDGSLTRWPNVDSGRRVSTATANIVYSPVKGLIAPYVIGGLGGYAERGRGLAFGANAGVGVRGALGRFKPFLELREHMWSADRTRRLTAMTIGISY